MRIKNDVKKTKNEKYKIRVKELKKNSKNWKVKRNQEVGNSQHFSKSNV